MTTPAGQGPLQPLWTNAEIWNEIYDNTTRLSRRSKALRAIYDKRDEYEAERAALHSQLAAANERIAELEDTLAFAAQYKGIEARSCPLCKYEDGEFVEACQMHKDMDAQQAQVTRLEADRRQSGSDWLALMRKIAEIDDMHNEDEWTLADDATLLEQFDPWQALRELKAQLTEAQANERKPMRVIRNTSCGDALMSYLMDEEEE